MTTQLQVGDYISISSPLAHPGFHSIVEDFTTRVFKEEGSKKIKEALKEASLTDLTDSYNWRVRDLIENQRGLIKWVVVEQNEAEAPEPMVLKVEDVQIVHRPTFKKEDRVQLKSLTGLSYLKNLTENSIGTIETVYLCEYEVKFDSLGYALVIPEGNLGTHIEPPTVPEEPVMPTEREPSSFRLSTYTAKRHRWRPSANIFQLVATKLAEVKEKPNWVLKTDGAFGNGTQKVAEDIQREYNLSPVDGQVGTGTWKAITPDLGTWRPPLRLRIAECQCSWEAGSKGYGYYGLIPYEGWWNWGIWNVNRGSARTLTSLGGANHLHAKIKAADAAGQGGRSIAAEVAEWFGSENGRKTQVGSYFLKYTIKPSLKNLVKAGWPIDRLGFSSLAELDSIEEIAEVDAKLATIGLFEERLILHACDITVNSGAGGYFPKKSPRQWDKIKAYDLPWPEDKLPPKDVYKEAFAQAFDCTIESDRFYCTSSTRDTYMEALNTCLWTICKTDEQRLALSAELQARCVIDQWREMVIQRRRAAAWPEGHVFQSSDYSMKEDFGIGI